MKVNPTEAAQIAGVTRKTLYADMQKGTLSYEVTDKKKRLINVAELERVYGTLTKEGNVSPQKELFEAKGDAEKTHSSAGGDVHAQIMSVRLEFMEKERAREREQLSEQIEHLRSMLKSEQEERRKITALLTDQSAEREQQGQVQKQAQDELDMLKQTVLELKKQNRSIFKALKDERNKSFWQKLFG